MNERLKETMLQEILSSIPDAHCLFACFLKIAKDSSKETYKELNVFMKKLPKRNRNKIEMFLNPQPEERIFFGIGDIK